MALVVGLDISDRQVRGAVFDGTARKFRLVDYFSELLPSMEDTPVELRRGADRPGPAGGEFEALESPEEVVQRVLRERGLERAEFVAAVDAADCGIREFSVPFTRDEQIGRTVSFEAEHHFHAFDIDDVILEWIRVGEGEGQTPLIVVAARKRRIEQRLETLKRAQVDPISLDLDAAAVTNAFRLSPYSDEERSFLLVDLSAASAKIVLLEGGRIRKIRALRTSAGVLDPARMIEQPALVGAAVGGGAAGGGFGDALIDVRFEEIERALRRIEPVSREDFDLDSGGAGDLELPIAIVSDEEYERLSPDTGAPEVRLDVGPADESVAEIPPPGRGAPADEPEDAATVYAAFLERIGIEVQRTLVTTPMERPLDLVCLTGSLAHREEARRFFQDLLDVETVELEFGDALPSSLDPERLREAAAEGAVAVGLAAKGIGRDPIGIDFRKGPYRYEHRFERLRLPLLNCAVLLFLVFLQTTYWGWQRYQSEKAYAVEYQRASASAFGEFFEKQLVAGRDAVDAAVAQRKAWESGGAADVGRFMPFVEVMRDFKSTMDSMDIHYKLFDPKFNLRLKSSAQTGKSRSWTPMGDSKFKVVVERSDANILIDKAFETKSKFFTATTSPKKEGDDTWSVIVTLTPKTSYLGSVN